MIFKVFVILWLIALSCLLAEQNDKMNRVKYNIEMLRSAVNNLFSFVKKE